MTEVELTRMIEGLAGQARSVEVEYVEPTWWLSCELPADVSLMIRATTPGRLVRKFRIVYAALTRPLSAEADARSGQPVEAAVRPSGTIVDGLGEVLALDAERRHIQPPASAACTLCGDTGWRWGMPRDMGPVACPKCAAKP